MPLSPDLQALINLINISPYRGNLGQNRALGGLSPEELVAGLSSGSLGLNRMGQSGTVTGINREGGAPMDAAALAQLFARDLPLISNLFQGSPDNLGSRQTLNFGRERTPGHAGFDTGGQSSIQNPFFQNPDFARFTELLGGFGQGRPSNDPTELTPQQRTQLILEEQAALREGRQPDFSKFNFAQSSRPPANRRGGLGEMLRQLLGNAGGATQDMFVGRQQPRAPAGFQGLQSGGGAPAGQNMSAILQQLLGRGGSGGMFVPRQQGSAPPGFGGLQSGDGFQFGRPPAAPQPNPIGGGPPQASGGFQAPPPAFNAGGGGPASLPGGFPPMRSGSGGPGQFQSVSFGANPNFNQGMPGQLHPSVRNDFFGSSNPLGEFGGGGFSPFSQNQGGSLPGADFNFRPGWDPSRPGLPGFNPLAPSPGSGYPSGPGSAGSFNPGSWVGSILEWIYGNDLGSILRDRAGLPEPGGLGGTPPFNPPGGPPDDPAAPGNWGWNPPGRGGEGDIPGGGGGDIPGGGGGLPGGGIGGGSLPDVLRWFQDLLGGGGNGGGGGGNGAPSSAGGPLDTLLTGLLGGNVLTNRFDPSGSFNSINSFLGNIMGRGGGILDQLTNPGGNNALQALIGQMGGMGDLRGQAGQAQLLQSIQRLTGQTNDPGTALLNQILTGEQELPNQFEVSQLANRLLTGAPQGTAFTNDQFQRAFGGGSSTLPNLVQRQLFGLLTGEFEPQNFRNIEDLTGNLLNTSQASSGGLTDTLNRLLGSGGGLSPEAQSAFNQGQGILSGIAGGGVPGTEEAAAAGIGGLTGRGDSPLAAAARFAQEQIEQGLGGDTADAFQRRFYEPGRDQLLERLNRAGVLDSSNRLRQENELFRDFQDTLLLRDLEARRAGANIGMQAGALGGNLQNQLVNQALQTAGALTGSGQARTGAEVAGTQPALDASRLALGREQGGLLTGLQSFLGTNRFLQGLMGQAADTGFREQALGLEGNRLGLLAQRQPIQNVFDLLGLGQQSRALGDQEFRSGLAGQGQDISQLLASIGAGQQGQGIGNVITNTLLNALSGQRDFGQGARQDDIQNALDLLIAQFNRETARETNRINRDAARNQGIGSLVGGAAGLLGALAQLGLFG